MARADDYRDRVQALDHAGLLTLWERVRRRDTPDWPPGKAFEYLLLRAFELEGAAVSWPYAVPPAGPPVEQIDGAVHTQGLSCLIEAKDEREPINVEPLAKLRNQLLRRHASALGLLFAISTFTEPAKTLSRHLAPQIILLWPGDDVTYALERGRMREGLLAKYRYAVEYADPTVELELLFP